MLAAARALRIEGDRVSVPSTVFDHAGFRAWAVSPDFPDHVRATFIDGEVLLEMSPEEIETHNKVKGHVYAALLRLAEQENLGEAYADGVLVTHPEAGLSAEPDITFVSWASLESGRVRLLEASGRKDRFVEIEGSPDLVVEVVSESSVRKDTVLLRQSYVRAGVSEYWIIDARSDTIRYEILLLDGDGFRSATPVGSPQPSQVFGRTFTLTRARNRAGRFTYRLATGG